jgi:GT2 family glycosyltransferase/glycosyltransferase involved in cell wall biosynthesis
VDNGIVAGWAWDTSNPSRSISVEVLADGKLIGTATAETFRGDLLAAKIGTGNYGFRFELPYHLFDGTEHVIDVRERHSGAPLNGSPQTFSGSVSEASEISLEGSALAGRALLPRQELKHLPVEVREGDVSIATGTAQLLDESNNRYEFRLPLPGSVFDGRAHHFTVLTSETHLLLAQIVLITPISQTPTDALQTYAREGMSPSLSNIPALRYEALSAAVSSLMKEAPEKLPARLAQLDHCHSTLVRGVDMSQKTFLPLHFEAVSEPDVSIVIPVHNKFAVTYHCLASLLLAPTRSSFEVIIVDDSSKDHTDLQGLIHGVTILRNEEPQGFLLSSNRGATAARGKYVVMLNNDTEVTPGWLDELIWPFEHLSRVGMTGAKLIYPNGLLQEAGGIVWSNGEPWNYGRYGNAADPRFNYTRQVDYLSGACVMLRTELWHEMGGFDEIFTPAYFEDTDLAFRVRDKSLKTVYAAKAVVIHYEGVSNGTSTASGMKRFQDINKPKFKGRWAKAFRGHGRMGADVELNKDRHIGMRALVLDVQAPQPDTNAGGYAAVQEMRLLQSLGFKCTFMPTNMAWMGRYTTDLERMGVECIYSPFAASPQTLIAQRGAEFDLVYITRYGVAEECLEAIREHAPQAKVVLNNADLHFLRELRAAIAANSKESISRAAETREKELAVMRKVDLVLTYTDIEKTVIQSHNLDATKIARCPWVTDTLTDIPGFRDRKDIAFLGGFNHPPNMEAVEWFLSNVMPLIRKSLPEVTFRIYGSSIPEKLHDLASNEPGVCVHGWVPALSDALDNCRMFVAPLQSGAGIKGKVIEALARGVPSVLSSIASEGINIHNGSDGIVAGSPASWADSILSIYNDQRAWESMSRNAQRFADASFGFSTGVLQMRAALTEAGLFTDIEG